MTTKSNPNPLDKFIGIFKNTDLTTEEYLKIRKQESELEYGYNSKEFNQLIAKTCNNFIISLTDEKTTYDVAFCLVLPANTKSGLFQRGIQSETSLLVAINGISSFCFTLNQTDIHASYVASKLNMKVGDMDIAEQITELIKIIRNKYDEV
jgi:hypothetical protein